MRVRGVMRGFVWSVVCEGAMAVFGRDFVEEEVMVWHNWAA